MSEEVTIKPKQLLTLLGGGAALVVGLVVFFAESSGKETPSAPVVKSVNDGFVGERGAEVKAVDGKIYIDEDQVSDGNLHSYNFYSENKSKTIYFFIVKASDGTYRAAANACEVCFASKKGFKQVGDLIRCENCQVTYPKDKIALEKGGCNPGPIDKNVKVESGKLVLETAEIEKVAYLF